MSWGKRALCGHFLSFPALLGGWEVTFPSLLPTYLFIIIGFLSSLKGEREGAVVLFHNSATIPWRIFLKNLLWKILGASS